MSAKKLTRVIEGGFRIYITKALLSSIYPVQLPAETCSVTDIGVTEGRVFGALFCDEALGVTDFSILSGELELQGSYTATGDIVTASNMSITVGELQTVDRNLYVNETVGIQGISAVDGTLITVVVTIAPNRDEMGIQAISITGGTLT